MINNSFQLGFFAAFIVLVQIYFIQSQSNEHCDKDSCAGNSNHAAEKYHNKALNSDWMKYITKIEEATKNYKPCPYPDKSCQCHKSVMNDDLSLWKSSGITEEMIDKSKSFGTHYQIIDHKLYRSQSCMFPFRCSGVEHFILDLIDDLPDMEFILNSRDWPQVGIYDSPLPILSFSKTKDYKDIMYPAWTFWEGGPAIKLYPTGLGRWDKHRESIFRASEKWTWADKKNKGFFRGSRTSAERDPLVLLSRKEPELIDAQYTKNQAWKSEKDTLGAPPASEIPLEEHCRYKYLFNFRGVAASFRFKHLFLCKSVVLHVGDDWLEFFYPAMKPWVHYIPVSTSLNDAKELLEFARANDEVAQAIAKRGFDFIWNHLTMQDVSCYWKKLLNKYANLMKYKPKLNKSLRKIS